MWNGVDILYSVLNGLLWLFFMYIENRIETMRKMILTEIKRRKPRTERVQKTRVVSAFAGTLTISLRLSNEGRTVDALALRA
ncbi:hypothetical protein, partial [Salinicoccus hispanicus]|uniref:hypothetical protein n=1 Tax=Salinicoccus hispanicus TaxID=157225 RepID=UPI001B862B7A